MFFKQKIEVISFKDFMSPAAPITLKKTPHNNIIYSLLPGASIDGFFNMSPEVAGAYALVLGVGAFAILSGLIGNKLADKGLEHISDFVDMFTRNLLPVGAYGFMLYLFFKLMGGI